MANRRMFSFAIINSARFLRMPAEAQNLYFHLCMRADDDGIVEGFSVMRTVGAAEDTIKLLHAKEFIKILNEDLVLYVLDWHEHNNIRADRKVDSVYQSLLLQIVPEVEITQPKKRSDLKNKSLETKKNINTDGPRTDNGQSADGQWTAEVRLGKDSIGKDSIAEISRGCANYLKTHNLKDHEEILSYLDSDFEPDLILEVIKDSAKQADKSPIGLCKRILDRCFNSNIKTLEQYIQNAKEFNTPKTKNKEDELDYFQKVAKGLIL